MSAKRPTFAECCREAAGWQTRTPVVAEIAAILRTLAAGHDARTVRVTEDGRVVWWNQQRDRWYCLP